MAEQWVEQMESCLADVKAVRWAAQMAVLKDGSKAACLAVHLVAHWAMRLAGLTAEHSAACWAFGKADQ